MEQSLVDRVLMIWNENISPQLLTLQTLKDVVTAWEALFNASYNNLDEKSSRELSDALGVASRILIPTKYFGAATQLLIEGWKETGKKQKEVDCKIYRAGIAFYLSEIYLQQGDKGAAFWWQLHALADDYLEGNDGGGASIVLETILGIPKGSLFDNLKVIAVNHRNICKQGSWRDKLGFAEDVIVNFTIKHPKYASTFAYPTNEIEFPISPGYLNIILENIEDDVQGIKLEHLACYLFLHIPGCTPAHNLLDEDKTAQTDVVIRNLTPHANLVAETLGRHFIVECKNWTDPVGSAECGYFLHRIHLMHFSFGVMLAKNGITGTGKNIQIKTLLPENYISDEKAARQLIRRSFHEDNVTCIVLNLDHLMKLAADKATLRALLFEEIEYFRFGKSYSSQDD